MIFVTLGTHELEFSRILKYIEDLDISEKVIIQSGNTDFKSNKYEVHKFLSNQEFDKIMKESELIICHGGVGSILSALRLNKKVITVPRLSRFKEHNDDHQYEICKKFDKDKYIINCMNFEEFKFAVENYKDLELDRYTFDNSRILDFINNYIENL